MYGFFREKAQRNRSFDLSDMNDATSKSLEQLLTESLVAYLEIISDSNMLLFFRVLYSERSIDPKAAEIVLEETDRMIRSTKSLFYALTVHGKMKMEGVDTAATVFALTVHSLIDYRMDAITAGITDSFGEDGSPCTKALTDFVHWFSLQVGGDCHEQKTH